MGSDWRDDLPTDEEEEKEAYEEYVKARDAWLDNKDFFNSWHFLDAHPTNRVGFGRMGYSAFTNAYDIMVVKVNPETKRVESHSGNGGAQACPHWDDWSGCECGLEATNTETDIWIEWGPPCDERHEGGNIKTHDTDVDTGGSTFEEAICSLADKIYAKYKDADDVVHSRSKDLSGDWITLSPWEFSSPSKDMFPGARVALYELTSYLDENSELVYPDPTLPTRLYGTIEQVESETRIKVKVDERFYPKNDRNKD